MFYCTLFTYDHPLAIMHINMVMHMLSCPPSEGKLEDMILFFAVDPVGVSVKVCVAFCLHSNFCEILDGF